MQITVMSEGSLLNYILKWVARRGGGGFQALLTQLSLVIV